MLAIQRMQQESWKQLAEMVGAENISSDSEWLAERGWDAPLPAAVVCPSNAEQVCEILRLARAERLVVAPAGHGTKQRMGGVPQRVDLLLSMSRMNGTLWPVPERLAVRSSVSHRSWGESQTARRRVTVRPIGEDDAATAGVVDGVGAPTA